LKSIYWALTLPSNSLKLSKENNQALIKIAETYTSGASASSSSGNGSQSATGAAQDDKTLSNTAREVLKICKSQQSS
jgi:hypothetical protein